MLKLLSQQLNYGIQLPTDLKELTPDVLSKMSEHISLAPNYCLIALTKRTTLAQFIFATSGNKNANIKVSVVALLAKANDETKKQLNINVGDALVIAPSDLERGNHIHINTCISDVAIKNYLDTDNDIRTQILKGEYTNGELDSREFRDTDIYIVEFKIVPATFIHGAIVGKHDPTSDIFYIDNTSADDGLV